MPANITFFRPLYPPAHEKGPTHGGDVIAWKRALSRWDSEEFGWKAFDEAFNKRTAAATREFQKRKKLPITGAVGRPTFAAMATTRRRDAKRGEWAFDATAIQNHNFERKQWLGIGKEEEQRKEIALVCFRLHDLRFRIGYSQYRPVSAVRYGYKAENVRMLDCSGMCLYVYWYAGAPSPDPQYGYTGYGNTWSMSSDSGNRFREGTVKVGDLAFYGSGITHMACVVALNPIRVVSHGSSSGPHYYELRYRDDFQYFHRKGVTK